VKIFSLLMGMIKSREAGMFFILLLLMLIITWFNPDAFLNPYNLHNLLRQIGFLSIFAIGVTFVIITAGIDLSVGSLVAFCGVLAAVMMDKGFTVVGFIEPGTADITVLLSTCMLVMIAGALVGVFHGVMVSVFEIPPFVVTLGTMCILRSVAYLITSAVPVPILNEPYNALGNEGFLSIPFPASPNRWSDNGMLIWVDIPIAFWMCILVAIISSVLLVHTRFGRNVYAIGGNEQASYLSGVSVFWTKVGAYAYCSGLTAVSGILFSAYDRQGNPSSGVAYELNAIAAAVIGGCSLMGGAGSVSGTLIGASIFAVIINGINLIVQRNASFWEGTIVGIVIVAAVTFNTIRTRRQRV
jgi:ribose/xylose/arabinose/galactoside ABC-type transport system permease subunit